MASELYIFEQGTPARASEVNKNFELVEKSVTDLKTVLEAKVESDISSAKTSLLEDIQAVNDKTNSLGDLPHIIRVSDTSLLPSFYRIWSDGWCEQGGSVTIKSTWLDLLIPYKDTNFNAMCVNTDAKAYAPNATIDGKETGRIKFYCLRWTGGETTDPNTSLAVDWKTSGYINLEELENES